MSKCRGLSISRRQAPLHLPLKNSEMNEYFPCSATPGGSHLVTADNWGNSFRTRTATPFFNTGSPKVSTQWWISLTSLLHRDCSQLGCSGRGEPLV